VHHKFRTRTRRESDCEEPFANGTCFSFDRDVTELILAVSASLYNYGSSFGLIDVHQHHSEVIIVHFCNQSGHVFRQSRPSSFRIKVSNP
jgi:hypothetical protein